MTEPHSQAAAARTAALRAAAQRGDVGPGGGTAGTVFIRRDLCCGPLSGPAC